MLASSEAIFPGQYSVASRLRVENRGVVHGHYAAGLGPDFAHRHWARHVVVVHVDARLRRYLDFSPAYFQVRRLHPDGSIANGGILLEIELPVVSGANAEDAAP